MKFSGWRTAVSGEKITLTMLSLLITAFAMGVLISVPAWSQEESSDDESTGLETTSPESTSHIKLQSRESTAADKTATKEPVGQARLNSPSQRQLFQEATAQDSGSGDLAGKEATASDANEDGDRSTDLVTIEASDCIVEQGATITFRDKNGVVGVVVDGFNAFITSNGKEVQVRGTDPDSNNEPILFIARDRLKGSKLDVTDSTGINCAAESTTPTSDSGDKTTGNNSNDNVDTTTDRNTNHSVSNDQSSSGTSKNGAHEVIRDTIPNKPLPDTGGVPLWPVAILAFLVVGAGLAVVRMRSPRG